MKTVPTGADDAAPAHKESVMKLRKVGTFLYKGSQGLYVEAVDRPRDQPRYAAIEYGQMEERESRALDRGAVVESTVLDSDPTGWLHYRIDDCLGK